MFEKLQRSILFPAEFAIPPAEDVVANTANLTSHWIETDEGRTEYFFLSATEQAQKTAVAEQAQKTAVAEQAQRKAAEQAQRPVVFFAHGNAELIDYWPRMLAPYNTLGFHVALIEYRSYGRSDGTASEAHITQDFIAGFDQVTAREDVDQTHTIFHGRSLGGGAMGALARHRTPTKMILESTFTSVKEMAKVMFPFAEKFVVDPFDTIDVIRTAEFPLLIMHGSHDEIVPFQHAEALAASAKQSTLVSFDAGHNDFPPDVEAYWKTIATFLGD